MDYITQPKDYWIAQGAITITRNALGNPNRIQGSVASGAVISCYIEGVEGLGLDNGRNPKRWPLSLSPTYFNSNTAKYVYVAIPRSTTVGTQAVVVFPSEKLDIYGKNSEEVQVGSSDYYYVWLQGILSSSGEYGNVNREWTAAMDFGKLGTYEDIIDMSETDWYSYSKVTGIVTFLKNITMKLGTTFNNLYLGYKELTGVATAETSDEFVDSETLVVTPSYALSKVNEDVAKEPIGFLKGLWVVEKGAYGIDGDGKSHFKSITSESIKSENYSGNDTMAGAGYFLGLIGGVSKLVVDNLHVRRKMVVEELEVKKWQVTSGDEIRTLASNTINRTEYIHYIISGRSYIRDEVLGWSEVSAPWTLRDRLLGIFRRVTGWKMLGKKSKVRVTIDSEHISDIHAVRCYFLATDDGRTVYNQWQVGDQVLCKTQNLIGEHTRETFLDGLDIKTGNVYWWRTIVRTSGNDAVTLDDGKQYYWFDLAYLYGHEDDLTTELGAWCAVPSDVPVAGDFAVQFGFSSPTEYFRTLDIDPFKNVENKDNTGRMNAITQEVNGGGAGVITNSDVPAMRFYSGLCGYDLSKRWNNNKTPKGLENRSPERCRLSPSGGYRFYGKDFIIYTDDDVDGKDIASFIEASTEGITMRVENLESKIGNDNLFGFHRGIQICNAIPVIQGYGLAGGYMDCRGDFVNDSTLGDNKVWRKMYGNGKVNGFFKDTIRFATTSANQQVTIHLKASTESNWDYIYVGTLDDTITIRPATKYDNLTTEQKNRALSGYDNDNDKPAEKEVIITVPSAGYHTLDVIYTKDSGDDDNDDTVWYRVESLSDIALHNLALQGAGNYTLSFECRTTGVRHNMAVTLCDASSENAIVPMSWTEKSITVNVTDASSQKLIFGDASDVQIRNLKIEKAESETAFSYAEEDKNYLTSDIFELTNNLTEVSDMQSPEGGKVYSASSNDSSKYVKHSHAIEAGKIYTLSFYCRGIAYVNCNLANGMCDFPTLTFKTYADSGYNQSEGTSSNGATVVRMTTEWTKHYIYFLATRDVAAAERTIMTLSVLGQVRTVYLADMKLQEGFACRANEPQANSYTEIKMTDNQIGLIAKGLGSAGINIDGQNSEINLIAGKVNFKMQGGSTNTRISIDPDTGTLHAVDGKFSGNIYTPYKRLTSSNIGEYETEDFYGDTVINLAKTGLNIQVEVPRETPTQTVHISLPKITADMLGCEVNIFNASGDAIEINGSGRVGSSSSDGYFTALVKPSVGLASNTTLDLNAGYEAKLMAIHNPYMTQHENYQYSWLCCYANINP